MSGQVAQPIPLGDLVARARDYLNAVPGAVQGESGDQATFKVACVLIRDFGLPYDSATVLFKEWNAKCKPPWTERELRAKLQNAAKYGTESIGHLVRTSPLPTMSARNQGFQQPLDNQPPLNWKGYLIKTWYSYENADGRIIYKVARIEYQDENGERKKEFPIWCNGSWGFNDKGVERVPFLLSKILQAPEGSEIWICEGEKDVLSLENLGFIATTNPGGAGKWLPEFNKYLKESFRVFILPDNDREGRKHAEKIARSLHGHVASLKILPLPNLPEHGDVSDFVKDEDPVAACEELSRLADGASEYEPSPGDFEDIPHVESSDKSFVLHWASEAHEPQPPIDWRIEPLFSAASVNLIVGEAGSKKTYSLLDAAVCVASGTPWLGFNTKPTTALIIDEESGNRRLASRLGDVMRGHHASSTLPLAYVCLARFKLHRYSPDIEKLRGLIKETNAGFVLIDALADVMLGSDENSTKDVHPVFAALRQIAEETGAAIQIIHHLNKEGNYRGSSAMKGAVDLMLKVESKPDSSLVSFTCEKARDEIVAPFSAAAHFELGRFHLACADPVKTEKRLPDSEEYVIRFLTKNEKSEIGEIMAHADTCTDKAARAAVYRLARKGRIKRVDGGGPGEKAVYDLVQQAGG